MFGGFGAGARFTQYERDKARAEALPVRVVTRAEFVEALIRSGLTRAKAEFQANVALGLGADASCVVGGERLAVRKESVR